MTDREFLFDDDVKASQDFEIEGSLTIAGGLRAQHGGVDPGFIAMTAASTTPSRWFDCDGQALSRTIYVALFAAIGTTYGGSGGTFNVPDLRSRMPVGASSAAPTGLTARARGATGGDETHLLTAAEMASHNHSLNNTGAHAHAVTTAATFNVGGFPVAYNTQFAGSGSQTYSSVSGGVGGPLAVSFSGQPSIVVATDGAHTHTFGNAGTGGSHTNMQPWVGIRYIIFAGA